MRPRHSHIHVQHQKRAVAQFHRYAGGPIDIPDQIGIPYIRVRRPINVPD